MRVAIITLSKEGARVAERILQGLPDARMFFHRDVDVDLDADRFESVVDLTSELFNAFEGLVYIAPCGVVARAVAPNIRSKKTDPAVVALDVGARYAVSLLSGHEGGANDLALAVSNIIGSEPVITTTSEALKTVIVGVGCRRGISSDRIVEAVNRGLEQVSISLDEVRLLASVDIKADEDGLLQAASELGIPLRFIASEEVRSSSREFEHSQFVEEKVNLPAVAEAAALLAGRRTQLILPKTASAGVTVAIARENCLWLESGPETR
jgi:cobalt-precorrin 5A hydrolase